MAESHAPVSDPTCIFCRIVAGTSPAAKVYEDERVLAFLDIAPLQPGHTLVIPKDHHAILTEVPAELMAQLGAVLPRIARAVVAATSAPAFNLHQSNGAPAGQSVGHVHVHVVPRRPGDGLGFRWRTTSYTPGEMEPLRVAIAAQVANG